MRAVPLAIAAACVLSGPALGTPRAAQPPRTAVPPAKLASLRAAIADVEAGRRTTPLIGEPTSDGEVTVTFLAKRDGEGVPRIISDATGWGDHADDTFDFTTGTMTRVGQGPWYFLEATVSARARIEYLVAHGMGDYRLDPYNPRQQEWHPGGPASEFLMPAYVAPVEFEGPPPIPAGHNEETTIDSTALAGPRRVLVYTPPGYRLDASYPFAVFHEGHNVGERGAPRVLDWLIARGEMEPIVAAFVESTPLGVDIIKGPRMDAFLAGEVPAWLASRYAVSRRVEDRAILGISARGKPTLEAATALPDGFGRVGLIIPGRLLRGEDISGAIARCRHRMRVTILGGQYDYSNLPTARQLRRALAAAGHDVVYLEVPEGHNPTTWRNHLREVFASLFPPEVNRR